MPLQLTPKERSTLAMILGLLVLGLIGMAVLRESADTSPGGPAPAASSERTPKPRS